MAHLDLIKKVENFLQRKLKVFIILIIDITQPVAGIEDADNQILNIKSKSWKGKLQTNGLALTRHKNNYIQLNGNGQNKIVK